MVFWLTGITASGKTSLGKDLLVRLNAMGLKNVVHFDGDELRKRPGWVKGHALKDRFRVLTMLIDLILEEFQKENIVIISTVSHKKEMRDYARSKIQNFNEIYLHCSSEICASRDYKGFYERAISDKTLEMFYVGVTEEYETSENPELIIHTGVESLEESSQKLINFSMDAISKASVT